MFGGLCSRDEFSELLEVLQVWFELFEACVLNVSEVFVLFEGVYPKV